MDVQALGRRGAVIAARWSSMGWLGWRVLVLLRSDPVALCLDLVLLLPVPSYSCYGTLGLRCDSYGASVT